MEEIERIEQAVHLFREWDDHFGGGLRRKAVLGQLDEIADLLRDSHPADMTQRLFQIMAHQAETAAMMSWDSGMQATAQRYYILALRTCKEAGDYAFGANILASMTRQLLYIGVQTMPWSWSGSPKLARRAAPPAPCAPCSAPARHGHTPSWAVSRAFRRATGEAEEALADADRSDDPNWIRYFDEAELAGVTGGRLLDLAQEHSDEPVYALEAATLIDRALKLRRLESMRSLSLDQAGLAQTYFLQRELEQAVSAGHKAIDLAGRTQSDRVRVQLADLYQLAIPHQRQPDVRVFRLPTPPC